MIPKDIFFNFPDGIYFIILVLFVPVIGWWLYSFRRNVIKKYASEQILEDILIPRSNFNYWGKIIALCLTLLLAIIAWMEPEGNGHYPPGAKVPKQSGEATIRRRVHDVIFLVDASASMSVNDTRTGETRLDYAKDIVDEVISKLQGENASLWAFTSEPNMLSPLTMDYLFVRMRLKDMGINEGDIPGTNFVEALAAVRQKYFSTISPRYRTLILLSDGEDTDLESMTGSKRNEELSAILNLVGQAETLHLRVFTVGIGTAEGKIVPEISFEGKPVVSHLDSQLLEELAKHGRGEYFPANEMTVAQIADKLSIQIQREGGFEDLNLRIPPTLGNKDLIYDLYFQFPLAAAILLLIFVIYFPDTARKREL